MTLNHKTSSALVVLLAFGFAALPAAAQTQVNISASNCIPRSADEFDESNGGPDGFRWENSRMVNLDDDENQDLICAVPFDPLLRRANGTVPTIEIKVDVIDGHPNDEVRVDLFGTTTALLKTASTTNAETGQRTLTLTYSPTSLPRFLWLRISVPDREGGSKSGVVGYQVLRY